MLCLITIDEVGTDASVEVDQKHISLRGKEALSWKIKGYARRNRRARAKGGERVRRGIGPCPIEGAAIPTAFAIARTVPCAASGPCIRGPAPEAAKLRDFACLARVLAYAAWPLQRMPRVQQKA